MAKDDKIIQELKEELDKAKEASEYYKKQSEDGSNLHKTEAVRELFDFPREKLAQRTRLNEKEILTFAVLKTNMQILDPTEDRLWPILFMENIMEMKISLKGKGRDEGMGIFQMQQEEKAGEGGYTP